MKHFSTTDLNALPSRHRAQLINSVTGYKSANLIGTVSPDEISNLAIFSSVVHLGSNPALLGFITRPLTVQRDTYHNLKANLSFTVNSVTLDMYHDAHHTAAKYPKEISEFSATALEEVFRDDFEAPFVKQSPVQLGCRYLNEYPIKENGCVMVVGAIEHVYISPNLLHEDHWVQLDIENVMSITGLDGYALPKLENRLEYAKPDQVQKSIWNAAQKK